MPASMRTRTRIASTNNEFKSVHNYSSYERPPLDLPDIVDDLGDRCVVVEARGKSASRQWFIVVDSPGGHFDNRMKIVPGIEREPEVEDNNDGLNASQELPEELAEQVPEEMPEVGTEDQLKVQMQFGETANEFQAKHDEEPFEPDFDGRITPQEQSSSEDIEDNSASANFPEVKEKFEPDWSESGTGFSQSTGCKADFSQSTPGTNNQADPFQETPPASEARKKISKVNEKDGELLEGFGQRPQRRGVGFRKMVRKNRILRVFQKHPKVKTTNANVIADEDVPFDGHGSRADVGTRGYGR